MIWNNGRYEMRILRSMILRRFIIAIAVIAALMASAWLTWPVWVVPVARLLLAHHGIAIDAIETGRPTLRSLHIGRVVLALPAAGYRVTLAADDIDLAYLPATLARGELQAAGVHSLAIAVAARQATVQPGVAVALRTLLPSVRLAQLPISTLHVKTLLLTLPAAMAQARLSGSLDIRDGRLAAALAVVDEPSLTVSLEADRDNHLELTVQRSGDRIGALRIEVLTNGQLDAALDIDLTEAGVVARERGWQLPGQPWSGRLDASWHGELPASLSADALQSLAGSGEARATLGTGRVGPLASVTGQLRARLATSAGRLSVRFDRAEAVAGLAADTLPAGSTADATPTLHASLSQGATVVIDLEGDRARLASGEAALRLGGQGTGVAVDAAISSAQAGRGADGWRLTAGFNAQGTVRRLRTARTAVDQVAATLTGTIDTTAADVALLLQPTTRLRLTGLRAMGLVVPSLAARAAGPLAVMFSGGRVALPQARFDIDGTSAVAPGYRVGFAAGALSLQSVALDLSSKHWSAQSLGLTVDGLSLRRADLGVRPVNLAADLTVADGRASGSWRVSGGGGLAKLHGTVHHDLATGAGRLDAKLDTMEFSESGRYLPALVDPLPWPVDFTGGRLAAEAHAQWTPTGVDAGATAVPDRLAGFYDLNLFKGMSTTVKAEYRRGTLTLSAPQVDVAEVDAGLPLTDIGFGLRSADGRAVIDDLHAGVLGGEVQAPPIELGAAGQPARFTLRFTGIDLGRVFDLQQKISGQGTLDGNVPVTLSDAGVSAGDAHFSARPPGGIIRYSGGLPGGALGANPGVKLAFDSLENFHFDTLDVRADYAPSGDLQMQVKLAGRNPALAESRPIHFNLNVSENVPDLLKTLRLGRDISERLEQRIKEIYRK